MSEDGKVAAIIVAAGDRGAKSSLVPLYERGTSEGVENDDYKGK